MDEQRDEAYKTYMSDSAVLILKALGVDVMDMPRYADMFEEDPETEETAEDIYAKFAPLRRDLS